MELSKAIKADVLYHRPEKLFPFQKSEEHL